MSGSRSNTPSSSSRLPRATGTSTSTSTATPPSARSSTPNTGHSQSTSAKYASTSSSLYGHSKHARSKSSLVHPKVLPFPDLSSIRHSRDSSRAGSPLSTPPIDRLGVTFDQMIMMRSPSSDAINGIPASAMNLAQSTRATSPSSTPALASSTSPPVSSPLAVPARSIATPTSTSTSARGRASTAPSVAVQDPSPAAAAPAASRGIAPPISTPNRTQGFRPVSPARTPIPRHTGGFPSTPTVFQSTPVASSKPVMTPAPPIKTSHTAPTTAVIPPPADQPLLDHLFQSFLKGTCADVRLVIRKWNACYHVHRMVLAQASFFHSLFLGGFSETTPAPRRTRKGKERAKSDVVTEEEWHGEDVELQFDDPNITRAAFEICLSRLYSPFPHLHFPTVLLPTASRPLTPTFPDTWSIDLQSIQTSTPIGAHLVTPRLLLSLLATTIYLGHASLMREVLSMILRTVGPTTVNRYLAFAVGDGVGEEEWEGQSLGGVKALDGVAKQIRNSNPGFASARAEEDEDMVEEVLRAAHHTPRWSTDSDTKIRDDDSKVGETPDVFNSSQIPTLRFPSRSSSMRSADLDPTSFASADARLLPHFYGIVGNKIGEACACWLARWGVSILAAELEMSSYEPEGRIWSHRGLPAKFIRALLSSDYLFVKDEMERYRVARKVLDLRRQGWEEEMEGAGDLSIPASEPTDHEWDEWEEEVTELQKVFAEGIHYCHMTFDDLSTIAADIDPSTSLPYAPLAVLQAAHWTAADLRARVTAHERAISSTAIDDENELGLTLTSSSIASATTKRRRPTPRSRVPSPAASTFKPPSPASTALDIIQPSANAVYHPVPSDETHRIGASGLIATSAQAQSGSDIGPDFLGEAPDGTGKKSKNLPHGEKNFFGLQGGRMTSAEIEERWMSDGGAFAMSKLGLGESGTGKKEERWSKIEPFRFSVEFWDVDKLGEKERFYSTTHFYAGSFFNCYVQMIKRKEKGVQLGIYLHRQSPNEPFPTPSAPRGTISNVDTIEASKSLSVPRGESFLSHGRTLSTSPNAAIGPGSPPVVAGSLDAHTGMPGGAAPSDAPYQDTRAVTKAYFSISCASALGTALIRFTSGPDSFAHSQSWGWKSSALKSEEYLAVPLPPGQSTGDEEHENVDADADESLEEGVMGWQGDVVQNQSSLRATVVVGVV